MGIRIVALPNELTVPYPIPLKYLILGRSIGVVFVYAQYLIQASSLDGNLEALLSSIIPLKKEFLL